MQEVSSVRSTKSEDARFNPKLELPVGKEQIQRKKDDLRALGKKAKTFGNR